MLCLDPTTLVASYPNAFRLLGVYSTLPPLSSLCVCVCVPLFFFFLLLFEDFFLLLGIENYLGFIHFFGKRIFRHGTREKILFLYFFSHFFKLFFRFMRFLEISDYSFFIVTNREV